MTTQLFFRFHQMCIISGMQCGSNKGAKPKTWSRGKQFGVRLTAPLGTGKWFAYMPSVMSLFMSGAFFTQRSGTPFVSVTPPANAPNCISFYQT